MIAMNYWGPYKVRLDKDKPNPEILHPDDEPTYPMKHYTGDEHQRLCYECPVLQQADVEILKSNGKQDGSMIVKI